MVEFQPSRIVGAWSEGFALDVHVVSSKPQGHNDFGHMEFDSRRSELGECLYRLKYRSDLTAVEAIVNAAAGFFDDWNPSSDVIVPVPPSNRRGLHPVIVLAEALGERLGLPLADCVERTRNIPQLKNVQNRKERLRLLADLHAIETGVLKGKKVLLFDDLYRSGATMNAVAEVLYKQGKAADVVTLAVTRTRE